ncbi:MAG: GspH/FimT family protein, partial [Rhodanobacter sp.]
TVATSRSLTSARISAASAGLSSALRATRAQAIVRAQETTFEVNTRAGTYRGVAAREVSLPEGMRLSITSATADRSDAHTGRIRFFPDGSSTGGRITLQRGQRQWHINVSWLTGAVSVVDTVKP